MSPPSHPIPAAEATPERELRPVSLNSSDFDEKKAFDSTDADFSALDKQPELAPTQLEAAESAEEGGVSLPWTTKVPVLIFVLVLTFGSNFAASSISPLKSTLKKELNINNAQYGVVSSAVSLVNSVLPLISGILIDYYGPNYGSIVSSVLIFIGSIVTALGASLDSYGLLVGGQVIFGFGSSSIEVCQNKWYAHYFKGVAGTAGYIGFVSGLDIGLGRVWNVAGKAAAIPIAEGTGHWAWALWVPAIFCGFTLALNIAYVVFATWRLPPQNRVMTGKRAAALAQSKQTPLGALVSGGSNRSRISFVGVLALPASYWILPLSQLLQAGTVGAYTSNLAEVVEITRGTTKLTAGYTASIGQVIPIVGTPLVGLFFDKLGRRTRFISATAALWVLVFALLAYSTVHPLVPTILGSVALTSNAIPFSSIIPLVVPQAYLGSAFGVWKCMNSAGSTIMDVAVGAIQDKADQKSVNQYDKVFAFLIAMKAVDVFIGLGYDVVDRRWLGRVLFFSERRRAQHELETTAEERAQGLCRPIRQVTILGLAVLTAMIVTSYVLFITYSM